MSAHVAPAAWTSRTLRWVPVGAALSALTLVMAACRGDDGTQGSTSTSGGGAEPSAISTGGSSNGTASTDGVVELTVVASFYPLQFVAERVGGTSLRVSNLTPVGAEPHDLEVSPRDMAALQDADLVVYLSGFAPALDDAIADLDPARVFDAAAAARLNLKSSDGEHADHDGQGEGSQAADDHPDNGVDPHFWLDPTRLASVADGIATRLAELEPSRADEVDANTAALLSELAGLDSAFRQGLADCASTDIVTSHTAFGYLADRYGLTQVGISGLSPEEEPSPAELAKVTEFVRQHDVSTIYYETLVDPAVAETVAADTGADTAVLDPIEGLTRDSAGDDYIEVMRSNLQTLRTGQRCT